MDYIIIIIITPSDSVNGGEEMTWQDGSELFLDKRGAGREVTKFCSRLAKIWLVVLVSPILGSGEGPPEDAQINLIVSP